MVCSSWKTLPEAHGTLLRRRCIHRRLDAVPLLAAASVEYLPTITQWTLNVLGATSIERDGSAIQLRRRECDVLAALAVRHPRPTSSADLSSTIWIEPPATAAKTLQNHVARIRRVLGPAAILTVGNGYVLGSDGVVDLDLIGDHSSAANLLIAAGDDESALLHLERARRLVRGRPFGDLESSAVVREARRRTGLALSDMLDQHRACLLRLARPSEAAGVAFDSWATADVLRGDESGFGDDEVFDSDDQVSERSVQLRALANYRADRRAEALRVLHAGRLKLREVGLPLGERTRRLEQLVLADDPLLLTAAVERLVDEPTGETAPTRLGLFIGRRAELQMAGRWLSMRGDLLGPPALVIVGPRGIGKTAMAKRVGLLAEVRGWRVVDKIGLPSEPLAAGESDASAGRAEPDEHVVRMSSLDPARRVLYLVDASTDLGQLAAEVNPATGRPLPSTVVIVGRPPSVPTPSTELALEPMDDQDARTLARAVCGLVAAEEVVDSVVRHAGGFPGLIVELSSALADDSAPLVDRLISLLPPRALAVAQVCALERAPVSAPVLLAAARGSGLSATEHDIADALAARVLVADEAGELMVRDAEIGAAVSGLFDPTAKARAHRAWVVALDAAGAAPQRSASHAVEAVGWPIDDTIRRLDAALVIERIVDVDLALDHVDRVVALTADEFGVDSYEHMARQIHRCTLLRRAGRPGYAAQAWMLVDRCVELGDEVNMLRALGLIASAGELSRAGAVDGRLIEMLDQHVLDRQLVGGESRELLRELAQCAARSTTALALADAPRCRAATDVALGASADLDEPAIRITALLAAYFGYAHPNDWPSRRGLAEEAFRVAEVLDSWPDRIETLQMLFSSQIQVGDPFYRATIDRMLATHAAFSSPVSDWVRGYVHAAALHIEGRLEECEVVLEHSRLIAPVPADRSLATYIGQLVAVRHAQGRLPELVGQLDDLARDQPMFPVWQALTAWSLLLAGETDQAVQRVRRVVDSGGLPTDVAWAAGMYCLGRVAAASDDSDLIAHFARELRPFSGLFGWLGHGLLGPFDLALAELSHASGDHVQAMADFHQARRMCLRLWSPPMLAELDVHPLATMT